MKYLATTAALLAAAGLGACTIEEQPQERQEAYSPPQQQQAHKGGGVRIEKHQTTTNNTTVESTVEIGMSRPEVVDLLGPPEYVLRESSDFGYEFTLWYGDWEIWISDGLVQTVHFYGSG